MDWTCQPLHESSLNPLGHTNFCTALIPLVKRTAAIALTLVAAGCARDHEPELPAACTRSPEAFVNSLATAPAAVRVEGTPISDCLAKDSSVGDVQEVGAILVATSQTLRREHDAVALGYLVGALRRGARESQGIHLELVRRVEQEAAPVAESAAFERGLRAGRTSG